MDRAGSIPRPLVANQNPRPLTVRAICAIRASKGLFVFRAESSAPCGLDGHGLLAQSVRFTEVTLGEEGTSHCRGGNGGSPRSYPRQRLWFRPERTGEGPRAGGHFAAEDVPRPRRAQRV